MRTSLAALALGITAVMVPSSAHAYSATFEVEDYTADSNCVNHTFDAIFDDEGAVEDGQMTVTVTDPDQNVVHTLRMPVGVDEPRRDNIQMTFCRYELVPGTYTLAGVFDTPGVQARRATNPATFEVVRAGGPVTTPPPTETSSTQSGHVRVTKVARGVKVVFKAGSQDQRWKVRVKGTTRSVKLEAGERKVKIYRGAHTVKIKTLGTRVF